jgi:hypothetical protein
VVGEDHGRHEELGFEIEPLRATEYSQIVGRRDRRGRMIPAVETSVLGDIARFAHFHPGETIPCIKTTIDGHSLATHELFDADQGGLEPCLRVASEMLDGGHIGTVEATHFHQTPGGIVPCVRTTIDGHSLATHELFDADQGGLEPCLRVASEMLEGGVLGAVEVTINDPGLRFRLRVGANTYILANGELQLERVS